MRKLYYYMAAALLLIAAGCQREEIASFGQDDDVLEVYASIEDIEDAQTRTYLSGSEVFWSSGDQIAVFMANTLRKCFDVTPESIDSKDATFQYDSQYIITGKNDNISHNVAYYPFCEVTCSPDGSSYTLGNLTLPSTQTYVSGSVGLGAFPMVAVTENTDDVNFRFKNLCGVMQFQLTGYGYVKSVSVKGNNEEVLSGPAVVTAGYGKEPSIAMSAEGGKIVTLDCGEGGVELNETTPVSFFIVLPPVQFEGGFTITVTDTWGGSKEYSTTKKNPVGRSKGLRMPAKEYIGVRQPQEGDYIDEYGVNHGQGVEIDGIVWAPVNCGYKAPTADSKGFPYGKLYQWGRKYGQGYSLYYDESLPQILSGACTLAEGQSADNSNVYFQSYSGHLDWLSGFNDYIWNRGTDAFPVKTEYDPCPDGWRIPTVNEFKNLCSNFSPYAVEGNQRGVWLSGLKTYSEGGTRLFLPAAGYRDVIDAASYLRNDTGWYRTSDNELCYYYADGRIMQLHSSEPTGLSVRCVQDDAELIPVESVTLSESALTMSIGNSVSLSAAIVPANANHQSAYWWSDDKSIATVDSNGQITAVAEGTTTITAMAGMQTAECEVIVVMGPELKDYVDEYGVNRGKGVKIDGVVWAPVNCGYHETDFKYGKLYQWGRKYGQGYSTKYDAETCTFRSGPVSLDVGQSENNEKYFYKVGKSPYDWLSLPDVELWNLGTEESPVKSEYDPCPEGWRVPTYDEFYELGRHSSTFTTNEAGQYGRWLSGTVQYDADASQIFLPAAGCRWYNYGDADQRDDTGYYWTSSYKDDLSYYIYINDILVAPGPNKRANGYSVRCVQE